MEQLEEAQQYQPHVPYWNEPRLSPTRRQAIETQAEGLRAQLRMDLTLTPGLRIRIEQELKQLERVLERAGSGDAVPPAQRSM